jgi:hypothetical protein
MPPSKQRSPLDLDTSFADTLREKAGGDRVVTFHGIPATAEATDHIRLYQDSELVSFIEIPRASVLEVKQEARDRGALVYCRATARLRVGAVSSVNTESVLAPVEPCPCGATIPMTDSPTPQAKVQPPPPPTFCSISVRWRLQLRKVLGPDGLIYIVPVFVPVYVMDCG